MGRECCACREWHNRQLLNHPSSHAEVVSIRSLAAHPLPQAAPFSKGGSTFPPVTCPMVTKPQGRRVAAILVSVLSERHWDLMSTAC